MTAQNPDNARSVTKYTGQNYTFTPAYMRSRDPTVNDLRDPKNQGYYPFTALWINKTNNNLWSLVKVANNIATWIMLSGGGSGPLITFQGVGPTVTGFPVNPDGGGNVTLTSNAGTVTITGTPNHINFDVTGGVGPPIEKVTVDAAATIVPTAGNITLTGNTVANATHAKALFIFKTGASSATADIQVATVLAATDPTLVKVGLAVFDSAAFSVDTNGWVQLKGGSSPAIQKFTVQTGTMTIVADGTGNVNVNGAVVAQNGHPLRSDGTGANTYQLEVQLSTANTVAASTSANAGVSSFNTNNFIVDANGFVSSESGFQQNFSNLGVAYNAGTGTFTVLGADGSNLSATNPAFVTISSETTIGTVKTIKITANQSFVDHNGASGIIGNTFGLTPGVAYAQDIPFLIYAILDSTETLIQFAICRLPYFNKTPTVGTLSQSGSTTASTEGSMFLMNTGLALANYASRPCLRVGWFRMQMTATNDWTVQTFGTVGVWEGMNYGYSIPSWNVPLGSFGAAPGSYFLANGGTAPIFATMNSYVYEIHADNICYCYVVLKDGAGTGTAGAGAVSSNLASPFAATSFQRPSGNCTLITGTYSQAGLILEGDGTVPSNAFPVIRTSDLVSVKNADWTAAGKNFQGAFSFVMASA
jgi:hypothetical protein